MGFALSNAALLSYEIGNKKSSELRLFRKQWNVFEPGDILLGDKMFCHYYDQAMLKARAVDSMVTLPCKKSKPITASKALKVLGKNDLLLLRKEAGLEQEVRVLARGMGSPAR